MKKYKIILFLSIAIVLLCVVACSSEIGDLKKSHNVVADSYDKKGDSEVVVRSSIEPKEEPIRIALIVGNCNSEDSNILYNSMIKEASFVDKRIEIVRLGTKSRNDYKGQVNIVKNCIKEKYDGIAIWDFDEERLKSVLESAKKKNIAVVEIGTKKLEKNVNASLYIDKEQIGEIFVTATKKSKIFESLVKKRKKARVVVFMEKKNDEKLYESIKESIKKENNIFIIDTKKMNANRTEAKSEAERILKEKKADFIYVLNSEIAVGVSDALLKNNKENVKCITYGYTKEMEENLRNSLVYVIIENDVMALGKKAVDYGYDLVKGEDFEEKSIKVNVSKIVKK